MRKLRIFLVEIICAGIFLGWLMYKYPEVFDALIPWIALAILWHLTWEFVLDNGWIKSQAIAAKQKCGIMAWFYAFLIGGLISIAYLAAIKSGINALAQEHSKITKGETSKPPPTPPAPVTLGPTPETGAPKPLPPKSQKVTPASEIVLSITVEARMTCTIKEGEELPPSTEEIIAGFGTGQLVGAAGTVELARTNPVEFRKQRNNEMVVVNHFYLANSEALFGSPVSRLFNYEKLILPITVLGSGKLFDRIHLVEVTVTINNNYTWYYPYNLGSIPFQNGLVVTIPLAGIAKVLH